MEGRVLREQIADYTVIDLETTGRYANTCEIIEMAAVRVRNGVAVDQFSSLVKPKSMIPSNIVLITGITNEMVQNAPCCSDILKQYLDFIGNDIIIGHNIRTFDCKIIQRFSEKLLHIPFHNDMIDTVYFARYCDISPENYKLTTLSAYFGLPHPDAHRALGDCMANYRIYEALKPLLTDQYNAPNCSGTRRPRRQSKSTKALLELSEYIAYMTQDNFISDQEINILENWMEVNKELAGNYPYDIIYDKITDILADQIITEKEREEMLALLIEQSDPIQHHSEECESIDFTNKTICLTGDFESGSRSEMEQTFEKAGAAVSKSVTAKTDYLIVGGSGSAAWSCGNYGNKVKKALELQGKGKSIIIIREDVAMKNIDSALASSPHEQPDRPESDESASFDASHTLINKDELFEFNYDRLIEDIRKTIRSVSNELNLPDGFLELIENQKSYSLWIIEPVTKKRSQMILTASQRGNKNVKYGRIEVKKSIIDRYKVDLFTVNERDPSVCYYDLPYGSAYSMIYYITHSCAENFVPSDKFGCCHLYRECSAAGKCLHYDLFYARACWYRKNLESGKIFY